jgi:hypothetical protein
VSETRDGVSVVRGEPDLNLVDALVLERTRRRGNLGVSADVVQRGEAPPGSSSWLRMRPSLRMRIT